jgi:hypothetical protein
VRAAPSRPPDRTIDLATVFVAALALMDPHLTYPARIRALVDLKRADRSDDEALDVVGLTPHFPQPMAASLAELGQHLLLPGLDGVPPNTAVPLETNSPFVEAYLVGLNAELARELLWREFPAPADATFFDRFWDSGAALGAAPDIPPISTWGNRALGATEGGSERFVMLVRSELLRRYPNAIIYATRPGPPEQERLPLFMGMMQPDVRYFGFDLSPAEIREWSIVIQEQPAAPRFGVEVGIDTGDATYLPAGGGHAAQLAQQLRQTPVRITIPATVLLGGAA